MEPFPDRRRRSNQAGLACQETGPAALPFTGSKGEAMSEDIFVVPVVFGAFAFVIWVLTAGFRRYKIAKVQAEVQSRLIDRFASSQDLVTFAQTDAGKQLLQSLRVERSSPFTRVIATVQTSIIMLFLGGALFAVRGRMPEASDALSVFGTVIMTMGIGVGISGAVSYALSKSFGLLEGPAR
jgi:hypothetical protein